MADNFPEDSVIRRVNLEPALMLGAGRALVMQLAHPAVAQGVQDHSEFKRNPFTRLQGTLEATYAVVFGSEDLAQGVGRRIRWIHSFVTGPGYEANDPANLLWVHATLADTALRCYTSLVGPLSEDDQETYYREMCRAAEAFGVPLDHQPPTLAAFRAYLDEMLDTIEVTPVGRDLIGFILDPELPWRLHLPFRPLLGFQRRFTLATLPEQIRDQLDVTWTPADQARSERAERRVRSLFRRTPRAVRVAPNVVATPLLLRQAARHVREWEARQSANVVRGPGAADDSSSSVQAAATRSAHTR